MSYAFVSSVGLRVCLVLVFVLAASPPVLAQVADNENRSAVRATDTARPVKSKPAARGKREARVPEKKSGQSQLQPQSVVATDPGQVGREMYQRLLESTAWVVITLEDGRYMGGTGWLVDKRKRLLVTNHHVINDQDSGVEHVHRKDQIEIFFPEFVQGKLQLDRAYYFEHADGIPAEVVDSDYELDLAVVRLDRLPDGVKPLPLADESPLPGDRVHSLGNPSASDAMWIYTTGFVRQVYQGRVTYGEQACDFMRVETQSPINPGDSGGPVVNDRGQLVAVTSGYREQARLISFLVDVSEVRSLRGVVDQLLRAKTADQLNERGVHYYDRGRYGRAVEDLSAAIQLDPQLADAYGNRGWSFSELGDVDTAVADFDAAIRLNGRDPNYYEGRARARVAREEYAQAVSDFTDAIRFDSQNADLYAARADARAELGKHDRAIDDYAQAIRLAPDNPEHYNGRAVCLDDLEEYEKAIADYTKAIELNAHEPIYYHNRAIAHENSGNAEQAAYDYWRMEQVDPQYAQEQRKLYHGRYLKIENRTDTTIHIWLKYHRRDEDGPGKWLPAPPDNDRWSTFTFEAGESAYLNDDGFRVTADRLRIWAHDGPTTSDWRSAANRWSRFETEDLVLIGDEGEEGYSRRTFELPIE